MAHPHKREADAAKDARHERIAGHSDKGADEKLIRKAFKEHDSQLHGGKKTRLKFAAGGTVDGAKPKSRADKAKRGKVQVNVMVNAAKPEAPGMAGMIPPQALPHPMAPAGMMPPPGAPNAAMMGMRNPMMGPMVGAPPPGVPIPPNQMMRKRGGRAGKYDAGAGSGEGRLEKIANYGHKAKGKSK